MGESNTNGEDSGQLVCCISVCLTAASASIWRLEVGHREGGTNLSVTSKVTQVQ